MGNGAMLGKFRPPRQPATPRNTSAASSQRRSETTRVLGRASDDANTGGDPNSVVEAGSTGVTCTRCSATRALPYGTVAYTCSACLSFVRVSLSTMSVCANADARVYSQKAEEVIGVALEEQAASCKQLWEGLKKSLCDEDGAWDRQRHGVEAARARELVRGALSAHDP